MYDVYYKKNNQKKIILIIVGIIAVVCGVVITFILGYFVNNVVDFFTDIF